MPIFNIITNAENNLKLAVWDITESTDELLALVRKKTANTFSFVASKNEQFIKQKIAVQLLLYHFYNNFELTYDEKGKPSLSTNDYVSISHSNNYAVVLINSKNECGVDIEKISEKVNRIKHKFLSENELLLIPENNIEQLTIYWSAKEALYKYYGKKEVIFNQHLVVEEAKDNKLKGKIILNNFCKKVDLVYVKINNFILVYTTS